MFKDLFPWGKQQSLTTQTFNSAMNSSLNAAAQNQNSPNHQSLASAQNQQLGGLYVYSTTGGMYIPVPEKKYSYEEFITLRDSIILNEAVVESKKKTLEEYRLELIKSEVKKLLDLGITSDELTQALVEAKLKGEE